MRRARITILPTTELGRWAVWLAALFLPLVLAASAVPRGAALGLVSGVAGGVAALTAIVRDAERAPIVFAALVPCLVAVCFVVVQLLTGDP